MNISDSITIDSYEILDSVDLVDETVTVKIIDALFTTTTPNWLINDPESPYYIANKPTKTSDFENDGDGSGSRYALISELTDQNKVNDVQVKLSSSYASILTDKIAYIDLSNFINKELKTGSESVYKVLSDNNFLDSEKTKLNLIINSGDGNYVLSNDGTYKILYNILTVNGVTPDENKEITLNSENIIYSGSITIGNILDKAVLYKSSTDKQIVLDNTKALLGKNNVNTELSIAYISSSNVLEIGSSSINTNISSNTRPTVNVSNSIAYLSDVTSAVTEHNSSITAHSDIRSELEKVEGYEILQLTNAEMIDFITSGELDNSRLVSPVDDGTYISGRVYQYNLGSPNTFILKGKYQFENIYGNSAPTTSTEGSIKQLYYDTSANRVYRCTNAAGGVYTWEDITPEDVPVPSTYIVTRTNIEVSSWTSDSSITEMDYKSEITILGVTSNDTAEIIFSQDDAVSGNYATICITSSDTVTIYSKVNTTITIPTILVFKGE